MAKAVLLWLLLISTAQPGTDTDSILPKMMSPETELTPVHGSASFIFLILLELTSKIGRLLSNL